MNSFIKQVIEEKFTSKNVEGKNSAKPKNKKVVKKKTEKEVDEVVDNQGNIIKGKKPTNLNTKGVTSNTTTDEYVRAVGGQMGNISMAGMKNAVRFWGESDMSKSLGYDETLGKDEDYEDAKDHFEDNLGIDEPETEERLAQMGYDKNLPDDKVRLVENPKKYIQDYLESIIPKKSKNKEIVKKYKDDSDDDEINPIILKQIKSLKNTLSSNNLTIDDVMKHLKKEDE